MRYDLKLKLEREIAEKNAREAVKNWKDCSIADLQDACDVFDGALLLLIRRFSLR